ncbi:hypothetical protein [Microlunatus parietis]|uniref:Uncharacterized protein n=1 Tax=Microlunatus parietis TaxID=682979 RepID=A0A7Y9LDL1_9ACTN|nr:hypothetical protein [Microlunatus parietis]NYE72915.1 hypothetical protein [Microlunatus parietis]
MKNTTAGSRLGRFAVAAGRGAVAGLAGTGVMLVTERVEQAITRRPGSDQAGRKLLKLLGREPRDGQVPAAWNYLARFGTGALLGAGQGIWVVAGLRGPVAAAAHTVLRLGADRALGTADDDRTPRGDQPVLEKAVGLAHRTVVASVTGLLLDRALRPLQVRQS